MSFSVIIPSRTVTNLEPCVRAVMQHERLEDVIVIDDGLPERWDGVERATVIPGERPFIFARNVNIGIVAAGDEDVVLLNDDAILETPGGLLVMAQAAEADHQIGIIGATCNNVGNEAQFPRGKGLRFDPRMVCFVCVYIPRRTIDRVGMLDERFVGYGFDDDDYCLRIRRAGLKIGIHDGCFVNHNHLTSTFRGNPRTPANLEQNGRLFREKWGRGNLEI